MPVLLRTIARMTLDGARIQHLASVSFTASGFGQAFGQSVHGAASVLAPSPNATSLAPPTCQVLKATMHFTRAASSHSHVARRGHLDAGVASDYREDDIGRCPDSAPSLSQFDGFRVWSSFGLSVQGAASVHTPSPSATSLPPPTCQVLKATMHSTRADSPHPHSAREVTSMPALLRTVARMTLDGAWIPHLCSPGRAAAPGHPVCHRSLSQLSPLCWKFFGPCL